ncbi:hypothetical protein FH493_09180 [Bacillus velezensis]|nr:hypothetical protein FH493_09180 [Bacillus velezensis]
MFLVSQIWLDNQFQVIISESASVHQKAVDKLVGLGGVVVANNRQDNLLGSVIVNGKRSVWPLTKSEGGELDGRN